MFYYAQLNEGNLCVGVSALNGALTQKDMVALESYDISLLGKRYVKGIWEEVAKEPLPQPESPMELMMQGITDLELQNLQAQTERQTMAQQMTDLELVLLERGENHV